MLSPLMVVVMAAAAAVVEEVLGGRRGKRMYKQKRDKIGVKCEV